MTVFLTSAGLSGPATTTAPPLILSPPLTCPPLQSYYSLANNLRQHHLPMPRCCIGETKAFPTCLTPIIILIVDIMLALRKRWRIYAFTGACTCEHQQLSCPMHHTWHSNQCKCQLSVPLTQTLVSVSDTIPTLPRTQSGCTITRFESINGAGWNISSPAPNWRSASVERTWALETVLSCARQQRQG